MKQVSELYNRHPGSDIYIIGTGASFRVFPAELLDGKITIGLNMAWKNVPVQYGITIHPDLNIPEYMPGEAPHPEITWITKYHKSKKLLTPDQFADAEARCYFFESDGQPNSQPPDQPSDAGRILDWVREPSNNLYQWSSISQTAVNLAAHMGAKNIILIGCDNCSLAGNHHAHNQHTRWKGVAPDHRYHQYYEGLAEIRAALREQGVNVVSMTPFMSLANPVSDFERLCDELGRERLIANHDLPDHRGSKLLWYVRRFKRMLRKGKNALLHNGN